MDLTNLSLEEKLELAMTTAEEAILELLLVSPEMLVRRAILRNRNISTNIANRLAYDVTENVSYIATSHQKCTEERVFHEPVSMCAQCKVDERRVSCDTCPSR